MALSDYKLIGPLAYRGKKGCSHVMCSRISLEDCMGWHCSYCDAPCSSQGHRCDAAEAVLGEAQRQAGHEPPDPITDEELEEWLAEAERAADLAVDQERGRDE